MKIVREEKLLILIPESIWEYNELQNLKKCRTEVQGFQKAWENNWTAQGGLTINLKDPYDN